MLRYTLSDLADRARIPSTLLRLRTASGMAAWITILTYHRVAPLDAGADFCEGTVDVTPEAFDRQLAYGRRWFDFIGIDDLFAFAKGGSLPNNPLLITFDDGYLDNREVALPILLKHGARAAFFIATTYVAERRLFWWDQLSYMIKRSTRERIVLTYPTPKVVPLAGPGDRERAFRTLRAVITDHFEIDLWRFLDAVAEGTGVVISREDERRLADDVIMTWSDVHALRAAGMGIQSHTRDHYVLPTLNEAHLREELGKSREILEGELGEPVRAIAYPVGRGAGSYPRLRAAVTGAGYELGFSNAGGINHRRTFDPLNVRRISLDVDTPDAYFKAVMAFPYLGY
jgi:peptidoglycan/xylan/chitin deacetylase (PgdA/CDA1 family)